MRNLVSLLLLAAVLTPLWAAGDEEGAAGQAELANLNRTGLPLVQDKVTLTVMAREAHLAPEPTNWNNLKVPQMFEELTNVHIEWQVVPNNAVQQKKNLAFASGDLPDLFFPRIINQADEVKYGGLGLLIPLNDLVDEWAPNVAALFERVPHARLASTTPSGNIYSVPSSLSCWIGSSPVTLNIHTGWLQQAGMGIPTDIDQFEAALTYFRDHDMNGNGDAGDEIPFGMRGGNIEQLMSIFGVVDAQSHRMVIDDKVLFTADRQYIAKGRAEQTLYGAFMDWHGENIVGTALMYDPATLQRTVYQPLRPLQTDTGKPPLWPTTRRFSVRTRDLAVTSANEHPEVTMRWIDTIYDPYWGMHWATSLPGEQWLEEGFTDDGRPIYRVTENPPGIANERDDQEEWAEQWLADIAALYHLNDERLQVRAEPTQYAAADAALRAGVQAMQERRERELAQQPKLPAACAKVLRSLRNHWQGLTLFVEDPDLPMDNNQAERALRGPVVGRKNYYGSGAQWSGELSAALFSLFHTLERWRINPRIWLTEYLNACAVAGGRVPADFERFLPWNRRAARVPRASPAQVVDSRAA